MPGTALIVGARLRFEPGSHAEILVADQEAAQVVARFEGRSPSVAADSAVVFLRDDPSLHGVQEHVSVHHYRRGAVRELRKIAMLPYLDVTEVVALGGERFVYGARDEHEQHYYDDRDRPFAPAPDGRHVLSSSGLDRPPKMKEQLGLRVSGDGKLAVLAERNWSELSYLVVADASGGARRELPVFGSFPAITGQHVVFSSDPSFVTNAVAGSRGFRQIEQWALYAYDLAADSLCLVGEYAHPVGAG